MDNMDKVKDPAVRLPEEFLEKMEGLLGVEYKAFVESYGAGRAQGLRLNTLKGPLEELREVCGGRFSLEQVPWCREGFYYGGDMRPGRHPFHEAGLYYIQEPSAMAAVSLLDPRPGEYVLDLCAAPGGKTTHIAQRLHGCGLLVSNEIHPSRAKVLSQNVERMGVRNCVVVNEPPERLKGFFTGFFDAVLVDAPCSGEGMFRKDEQARAEWSSSHVRMCAARQQEILDNAAAMLGPGGRMVYSTCTFSPEEDEAGVAAFLDRHPEFSVAHVPKGRRLFGLSPGRGEWAGRTAAARDLDDTFRIWPHLARGEGHYMALLEKCGGKGSLAAAGRDQKQNGRKQKFLNDREKVKVVRECLGEILAGEVVAADRLVMFGEQIYRLPEGMPAVDGLRVLRPGLHLGMMKKNRMEPSHALALALRPDEVKRSLALPADSPELSAYLGGAALGTDPSLKGWTLVCVESYSAGWGKASSGTLKNHYPKGLRIQGGVGSTS